jgi:hypothetical protein
VKRVTDIISVEQSKVKIGIKKGFGESIDYNRGVPVVVVVDRSLTSSSSFLLSIITKKYSFPFLCQVPLACGTSGRLQEQELDFDASNAPSDFNLSVWPL